MESANLSITKGVISTHMRGGYASLPVHYQVYQVIEQGLASVVSLANWDECSEHMYAVRHSDPANLLKPAMMIQFTRFRPLLYLYWRQLEM